MKGNKHIKKLQKPKGEKPESENPRKGAIKGDKVKYKHMSHWLEEDDEIVLYKREEE